MRLIVFMLLLFLSTSGICGELSSKDIINMKTEHILSTDSIDVTTSSTVIESVFINNGGYYIPLDDFVDLLDTRMTYCVDWYEIKLNGVDIDPKDLAKVPEKVKLIMKRLDLIDKKINIVIDYLDCIDDSESTDKAESSI